MPSQKKPGGIAWTDRTWNPTRGCSMAKGSELGACLNCYAAATAARYAKSGPFKMFARFTEKGARWTGKVELIEDKLREPLSWRAPGLCFVNSMSDLFHEELSFDQIDRVFDVMELARRQEFQVLTKRQDRMLEYALDRRRRMRERRADECKSLASVYPDFLPNVRFGVSVENQKTADARIPKLLRTPAAFRFVSYEPALGPVNFDPYLYGYKNPPPAGMLPDPLNGAVLDQIIVGGEGLGARPFDLAWAFSTLNQCEDAGVGFFMKQAGAYTVHNGARIRFADPKGGNPEEWPESLRVRNRGAHASRL